MAETGIKKTSGVKVCPFTPSDNLAKNRRTINAIERTYRKFPDAEIIPFARGTSFQELVETVVPDRDGMYKNKLYHYESKHSTMIGAVELSRKTVEFLEEKKKTTEMDILSVSSGLDEDRLSVRVLLRFYGQKIRFEELYDYLGEKRETETVTEKQSSRVIPASALKVLTKKEIEAHRKALEEQKREFEKISSIPVLNRLDKYTPDKLYEVDPRQELAYDLRTKDMQIQLNTDYKTFIRVFNECMTYITTTERDSYYSVLRGQSKKKDFFDVIEDYVKRTFVDSGRLPNEDVPALMKKVNRALFELYIVQDLIDDESITDIKITDPWTIRVRIKGKAYSSNITFIDPADYRRFVNGIAMTNSINLKLPVQTFTNERDVNYILRFSVTAPYITSSGYPIVHIRKIARKKLMADDLIRAGMFNETVRDYLVDRGKDSSIVFSGPPGSGKTTIQNWYLEDAYESSAEILVIQENDELFSYRRGVMFEHVVLNPQRGEQPCSLEQLGQMALVAGANVFVIGEARGAEICSAITLANSGCRSSITIHAQSSTDTIDKMVDLALRGMPTTTYEQAKRMLKAFQVIVYLEDFKVKEITEIMGYDENKKDFIYRTVYRYGVEKEGSLLG